MPRRQDNPYAPHDWAPHEKPALLGSPSTPLHSPAKRLAYGVVGLLVCLTGALGNAVVTANLQLLQVPSPPGRQKSPGCRRYT